MSRNILLIAGGDGSEHDISLISSKYVEEKLKSNADYNVISCVLHDNVFMLEDGAEGSFAGGGKFKVRRADGSVEEFMIDCAVPCLHGFPGETGDIQSLLELMKIPYIGCGKEASLNCFNKVTTKFYLSALNIENTPSVFVSDASESSLRIVRDAFEKFGKDVYVKAASQGSSIGCYHVNDIKDLDKAVADASALSPLVLVEKTIEHRELEVAAFEYQGKLHITSPGEIIMPSDVFYTFDEKYSTESKTVTTVDPEGLNDLQKDMIRSMAERAFRGLKLRHLSRIDFFLAADGTVYINEINTFPGMTPISMFPKMLEHAGFDMGAFLTDCVESAVAEALKD